MKQFNELTSIPAPLNMINIDTDIIIPKQFLRTIERTGLGKGLFYDMRHHDDGTKKDGFVLDTPPYTNSKILIAGENFGCGSSREHAPWALLDFGITCVIAPSFSDIFYNNCFKNGILPLILPQSIVDELMIEANNKHEISIDLSEQKIQLSDQRVFPFDIDPFRKQCLLEGLDDIGLTLEHKDSITNFESNDSNLRPWLYRS
jgi:3-isopropylmalate/(R)-2-methylmalate dehydratase small subunit